MKGLSRLLPVVAALAAAAGPSTLGAQDAGSANPDIPNMRAVMRSEYRYVPAKAPAAPLPELRRQDIPRIPPDVIQMSAIIVTEKRSRAAELAQVFSDQQAAGGEAAMMRKLGIGAVGTSVGKNFGAGVVTVFYVPVFVFAGFSW